MAESSATPASSLLTRTGFAVKLAFDRTTARIIFGVTAVSYLLIYLWGIGHLARGLGGFEITVVSNAVSRFFQPALGPFSFEPVAILTVGPVTYLFSLNTVIGLLVATLVGLNLSVSYLVWRQPSACGIGSQSAGFLAGIPALLSGTACCGPVVLLVVGLQATGTLLTVFEFLLPVSILLLVGTLFYIGRQVRPGAV